MAHKPDGQHFRGEAPFTSLIPIWMKEAVIMLPDLTSRLARDMPGILAPVSRLRLAIVMTAILFQMGVELE